VNLTSRYLKFEAKFMIFSVSKMGAPRKGQRGSPDHLDFKLYLLSTTCSGSSKGHFWKGAKFARSVGHPMTKMLSASGGFAPLTRDSAPGPRWGLCPWTPVIGSCSALAMMAPQPLTPSAAKVRYVQWAMRKFCNLATKS